MKKITVSASEARVQFFDLLNAAKYEGKEIEILNQKTNEVWATIIHKKKKKKEFDWKKHIEKLQKMKPFLTDKDVKEYQKIREELNTPRFPDW